MRTLLNKYKNLAAPVKASFWFLICGFLQKGISMLTTPFFTRVMTEEAYGSYSAFHAWLNIISVIASLNLAGGVYIRGLVKNEEDEAAFSSSMLSLSTVCIAAVLVLYLIFRNIVNTVLDMSTYLMAIIFLEIWVTAIYQFWSNKERSHYRYKKLVVLTLFYVSLGPILSLISVVLAEDSYQVHARASALTLVGAVLFIPLFISMLCRGKKFFSAMYWKYALKFNLPLVPHYLSQIILNESDRLMIKSMCGAQYAGYYSVAYSLSMVMQIFNNSISGVMNPWIYRCIKNGETKKIGTVSYAILSGIAILNFMLIAVAPEAMLVLAPGSYQAGVWVIPPITVSVYFMFLYNLFATFEYYYEKTGYIMLSSVSGAILNMVLNYIFIPKYGFVAAGYTTLVCYVVYAFAHYLFMRRINRRFMNGVKVYDPWIIIGIGTVLGIASALMMLLYNYPILRYTVLLITVLLLVVFRKRILKIVADFRNVLKTKS